MLVERYGLGRRRFRGVQKGGGNWNQVLLKGGSRGAMTMTDKFVFIVFFPHMSGEGC